MTARIIPIRSEQARRRRVVEDSLRDARAWIDAALAGGVCLADGVHGANRALIPAVLEACKAEVS